MSMTLIGRVLRCACLIGVSLNLAQGAAIQSTTWDAGSPAPTLQNLFDGWGTGIADVNAGQTLADQTWEDKLSTGSGAVLLLELAANANYNEIGIYKAGSTASSDKLVVFAANANPVSSAQITIPAGWSQFGFYLKNTKHGFLTYYSEPYLNLGGRDQMASFQGPSSAVTIQPPGGPLTFSADSWLVAWEDLPMWTLPLNGTDGDFNDAVLYLRRVPDGGGALMLLGVAVASLIAARRRLS